MRISDVIKREIRRVLQAFHRRFLLIILNVNVQLYVYVYIYRYAYLHTLCTAVSEMQLRSRFGSRPYSCEPVRTRRARRWRSTARILMENARVAHKSRTPQPTRRTPPCPTCLRPRPSPTPTKTRRRRTASQVMEKTPTKTRRPRPRPPRTFRSRAAWGPGGGTTTSRTWLFGVALTACVHSAWCEPLAALPKPSTGVAVSVFGPRPSLGCVGAGAASTGSRRPTHRLPHPCHPTRDQTLKA